MLRNSGKEKQTVRIGEMGERGRISIESYQRVVRTLDEVAGEEGLENVQISVIAALVGLTRYVTGLAIQTILKRGD